MLHVTSHRGVFSLTHDAHIGARKAQTSAATTAPVKFCSDRCRHRKPGAQDKKIEATFVALLNREAPPGSTPEAVAAAERVKSQKKAKGETRVVVSCGLVEEAVFGSRADPAKVYGRRKNRATRVIGGAEKEWKSVDMEDSTADEGGSTADEDLMDTDGSVDEDAEGGVRLDVDVGATKRDTEVLTQDMKSTRLDVDAGAMKRDTETLTQDMKSTIAARIRPAQVASDVNGSVGGEKGWSERQDETPDALEKRREGQKRADEREMVRRAARRLVAFGILTTESESSAPQTKKMAKGRKSKGNKGYEEEDDDVPKERRKKCEAIMQGQLVEPSFAKGDWGVRWREE